MLAGKPEDTVNTIGADMPADIGLVNARNNSETTLDAVVNDQGHGGGAKKVHLVLLRHSA